MSTSQAAAGALAEREPHLVAGAQTLGEQLRGRAAQLAAAPSAGADNAMRVRQRLIAAATARHARAAELTGKLLAAATHAPAAGVLPRPPEDRRLLAWLRDRTNRWLYTPAFEQAMARRWLGSDPFGLRALPDPPPFLAGLPIDRIPAEPLAAALGEFLGQRIELTEHRPDPLATPTAHPRFSPIHYIPLAAAFRPNPGDAAAAASRRAS